MWYRSRVASRRRAKPHRRNLPRLEMLEDRTVPSYLFRTFNIPGAGTGTDQGSFGGGINNLGQVVGEYLDANSVFHGFLLRSARYPHASQPAKMRRRARQEGLVRHVTQPIFLTRLLH